MVAEARQNMDEILTIDEADIDRLKNSGSRLPVGTRLSRADMLHLTDEGFSQAVTEPQE